MAYSNRKRAVRRARVYRSVAEKRRIVALTLFPGASVSRVAQAEGMNSHQVFDWRRGYRKGRLGAKEQCSCALLGCIVHT
jgi:transposase-like protein